MRIAMIGSGAMGSLFGGFLQKGGHTVWLIDTWYEHIENINRHGLIINSKDKQESLRMQAATDLKNAGTADVIFIFVKGYSTKEAIKNISAIMGKDTFIVTLQNGIGNIEIISEQAGVQRVIAGTTSYGATLVSPGQIYYAGEGITYLGEVDTSAHLKAREMVRLLNCAGIRTEYTDNVEGVIWSKLLINAGLNAITAITSLSNGKVIMEKELTAIIDAAVQEASSIVAAKKIKLLYDNPLGKVRQVASATANNMSSMAQDLIHGRLTEIEFINGAIVREGKKMGIAAPVNEMLTNLVKYFEKVKLR